MRLRTHYVFSSGLLCLVDTFLSGDFFIYFLFSALISVIGNLIIDRLGHKEVLTKQGQIPVRTPLTHTLPRSVLWGVLSIIPIVTLLFLYDNSFSNTFFPIVIDGVIVGPSHMLLDVFTEKGIYVKKGGKWRRFALAHYKYDNPFVNGLAIVIGVLMLIASLYLK
ncbi:hypothetical protein BFU36_03870 [Sulfolobus sp. A20]|uniref:DUF1286 domain-containing protein n=1 Tax=Saccharolobus sp. A20 TaxID=1891280 RepID=UPI000845F480|nr:DUF1286 domain-containing protein [Sulfolobus sp. A20]TRM76233.1 DUF1286 domain-containing protein [Sulfolobus sp. B5]TRM77572.1 DUF1286 domain-containing protein [Sulfolobus sp. A20-N-F8]TRM83352.1 DUF1286 domain-containing protein [Sulfolobus sp. A20-N-F6]TRM89901.1 DUF1286 domain-containing protein [Sulfolobus sp. C3]TRM93448.1 DUF1286 domain-containing protein [Sulfolobus sp. A20-N-G8]TRN01535.1 DUF1286 domain-containing protein [Sulfolobus sp. E1]TRN04296.1 DUF1286 domain-containing 